MSTAAGDESISRPRAAPSPDRSSGLSAIAYAMYMDILRSGGRTVPEDAEDEADQALRELLELGLLIHDTDAPGVLVVSDPRHLADTLSTNLQVQAAELIQRSVSLSASLHSLGRAYQTYSGSPISGGTVEYLKGGLKINQQLAALLEDCKKEVLTAQPGGGRRPEAIRVAIKRDMAFIKRGGTLRTIYQPSARYSAPTLEYVESVTQEDCQVRTLDEPFARLIVLDRKVAIIPVSEEESEDRAAFIRDEAVIGYIVQVFDAMWERAIPFTGGREIPPHVVSSMRQQIIRMMLHGIGHRIIARRLGLSERTLARHLAEMREEYGVDTLFQLGWKLSQVHSESAAGEEL